jgi:hypothetical protein
MVILDGEQRLLEGTSFDVGQKCINLFRRGHGA